MVLAGLMGKSIATSFLPDEDQGYVFGGVQLPDTASLQRNDEVVRQADDDAERARLVERRHQDLGGIERLRRGVRSQRTSSHCSGLSS